MTGPTVSSPVLVIGDSLAGSADEELEVAARTRQINFHVRAEPGRTIAAAVPILQATTQYSAIVIALGTNDTSVSGSTLDRLIADVLAAANHRHTWWVDVGLTDCARSANVNDALQRADRSCERLALVRWSSQVASTPSLLAADGVHLTPAGRAAFAAAIVGAVR